jgi:hypothetical protein
MTVADRDLPPLAPAAIRWLRGLQAAVGKERTRRPPEASLMRLRPPPTAAELDCEQELISNYLRQQLGKVVQFVNNSTRFRSGFPAIVITTSPAGLRAEKALRTDAACSSVWQACCCVTEFEYRFWCRQQPDADYRLHVNVWAWAKTRVPAARAAEFAAFPVAEGERHWLFRHGLAGCGRADHHSSMLYRSDGHSLGLLQADFREGVSGL